MKNGMAIEETPSAAPLAAIRERGKAGGVAQATVAALQAMIRDGRLRPGDALPPQRDLARDLNVSRATLREALSILATIGQIVARDSGKGFLCADPAGVSSTPSWRFAARYSLSEVYQFRYIVEPGRGVSGAMEGSRGKAVLFALTAVLFWATWPVFAVIAVPAPPFFVLAAADWIGFAVSGAVRSARPGLTHLAHPALIAANESAFGEWPS